MKKFVLLASVVFLCPSLFALSGEEILKKSDAKWVPKTCSYTLSMVTQQTGNNKEDQFKGYKKGESKNVMIVTKPQKISGTVFLRKGDVIWSYYTTNQRLNKVAFQSVFMGSLLSYGDVLATELSFDYSVANVKEEATEYILTLTPRKDHTGYGKIEVYIDKASFLPKKRLYFALSGILLKSCVFNKIEFNGKNVALIEQEFFEPLKDRKTIVTLSNVKILGDVAEKYYNENFIKYLSGEK